MKSVYQDHLLNHFRSSAHRGTLENPTFSSKVHNPSCGDTVSLSGTISDGKIVSLKFEGTGCVISQAAASLLAEHCEGKLVSDVIHMLPEAMIFLVGIPLGPTRMRCALLALEALKEGLLTHA